MKTRSEDWQGDSATMEELQKYNYWLRQRGSRRIVPLITDIPKTRYRLPKGSVEELIKQLEQKHASMHNELFQNYSSLTWCF